MESMENMNMNMKNNGKPAGYREKFAGFIEMCEQAKGEAGNLAVVARPCVLGDTYDELIESLGRLADAGLHLAITSRCDCGASTE